MENVEILKKFFIKSYDERKNLIKGSMLNILGCKYELCKWESEDVGVALYGKIGSSTTILLSILSSGMTSEFKGEFSAKGEITNLNFIFSQQILCSILNFVVTTVDGKHRRVSLILNDEGVLMNLAKAWNILSLSSFEYIGKELYFKEDGIPVIVDNENTLEVVSLYNTKQDIFIKTKDNIKCFNNSYNIPEQKKEILMVTGEEISL